MTKARDLANIGTTLASVSTTELGYLDGVTSAIQTQIDGKASTTADIPKSLIDAKGDLIVGSANDTAARLAVGTNNYVLTADSAATNGVKWAAPAAGGKVLQVVSTTYSTSTTITSTTYTDSGLSLSITPSATSSKILILATVNLNMQKNGVTCYSRIRGMRGSTEIIAWESSGNDRYFGFNSANTSMNFAQLWTTSTFVYLDSPSTTSSTTYKVQGSISSTGSGESITFQFSDAPSILTLMEIGA